MIDTRVGNRQEYWDRLYTRERRIVRLTQWAVGILSAVLIGVFFAFAFAFAAQ